MRSSRAAILVCVCQLVIPCGATLDLMAQGPKAVATEPEWPGLGGPHGDFTVASTNLADSWPEGGPKQLWKRALGEGHSGIVVDHGRLYTMYREPTGQPKRWRDEEIVVALDAATGRTIWEHRYPAPTQGFDAFRFGAGPHSTPLAAGSRVFTIGTNRQLFAFDKLTGRVIWSHDLVKEYNAPRLFTVKVPEDPGYAASPVAYKDMVIVPVGGAGQSLMAFRQGEGTVAWRSGTFDVSPATPIIVKVQDQDQLVMFAGSQVLGFDPSTGRELWSHPHPVQFAGNISPPIWGPDNLLLVSSSFGGGTRVLQLARTGGSTDIKELWATQSMRVYLTVMVRVRDLVLGSNGDSPIAPLAAINIRTGEIAWRDRSFLRANLLYARDKLIILDEDGNLGMATVSSQGLTVLATAHVLTTTAWTPPTLVNRTLYLRDRAHILALELPGS